jgi:hypothetical protein
MESTMAKLRTVPEGRQRVVVEPGIYRKTSGKYLAQFRDLAGSSTGRVSGRGQPEATATGHALN